ncbi:hypothetical protein [Bauldia litoralis]|uniref:HicA toxin of toxin-antitoxin n=1 Tax=Bauldia litoralis TaxID=665467 RepID=A0A1G6BLS2_9HYPH|nr:hypothetical protein [Bauldia litoralis]SDB21579.1 hypothetical protein SAMN02982931_01609 [Bauldia litoralis]
MDHRHRKVLHALFAHPVSGNINFTSVQHMLTELGADIDNRSGARIGVTLKGHTVVFHHAHKTLPVEEVLQVKKFLTDSGIDPADYPV